MSTGREDRLLTWKPLGLIARFPRLEIVAKEIELNQE
jgi:hypothetical protein